MSVTVRGTGYPFAFQNGRVVISEGIKHLKHNIAMILLTTPGEMVVEPTFGCNISTRAFDPLNVTHLSDMDIREAITLFEPRVVIEEVEANMSEGSLGKVAYEISFREKGLNEPGALSLTYEG